MQPTPVHLIKPKGSKPRRRKKSGFKYPRELFTVRIAEEKSRIGDWEGETVIGRGQKGAILSHVDRKSKYTKLALLPEKTRPLSKRPAMPLFFPSPTRSRPSLTTTARSLPDTPASQPRSGRKSTSPRLIIPGSGASTNTPTASCAGTSQKARTSLPSLTPGSNGSKTNSTPVPERRSAPKHPARFSSPPLEYIVAAQG